MPSISPSTAEFENIPPIDRNVIEIEDDKILVFDYSTGNLEQNANATPSTISILGFGEALGADSIFSESIAVDFTGTNFLDSSNYLTQALTALDVALKTVSDDSTSSTASLQAQITSNQNGISLTQAGLTSLDNDLNSLKSDVIGNTQSINNLNTNLSATQSDLATLQSDFNAIDNWEELQDAFGNPIGYIRSL